MKRLFVSVFTLFIVFSLFAKNDEEKYDSDFYNRKYLIIWVIIGLLRSMEEEMSI